MTDYRALCAELCATLEAKVVVKSLPLTYQECGPLLCRARAALAQPEPVAPTVMQILALSDEIEAEDLGTIDLVRRALARWGTPAIHPVPVAPTDEELMDLAEEAWVPFAKSQPHPQGHPWDLVLARAVLARWGQP